MEKRYEMWTRDGVVWSSWIKVRERGDDTQFKARGCRTLKNEYREG